MPLGTQIDELRRGGKGRRRAPSPHTSASNNVLTNSGHNYAHSRGEPVSSVGIAEEQRVQSRADGEVKQVEGELHMEEVGTKSERSASRVDQMSHVCVHELRKFLLETVQIQLHPTPERTQRRTIKAHHLLKQNKLFNYTYARYRNICTQEWPQYQRNTVFYATYNRASSV